MSDIQTTVVADDIPYIPFALPESEGVFIKILRADEQEKRVIAKVRFEPGASAPRHHHYCRAIAHTLSGSWKYDEGSFSAGDTAVEPVGNTHTPSSEEGTEMLLILDSDSDDFLDNYLSCGTCIRLGMRAFKALEGLSLEDAATLDIQSLVEIIPATEAPARD